jgi:hypothetical protein
VICRAQVCPCWTLFCKVVTHELHERKQRFINGVKAISPLGEICAFCGTALIRVVRHLQWAIHLFSSRALQITAGSGVEPEVLGNLALRTDARRTRRTGRTYDLRARQADLEVQDR